MLFDFADMPPQERYKVLISTITPRPIAWITSMNKQGIVNAAPFSFFNAMIGNPPIVAIGIGSHEQGRPKDTRANIEETGQFVVNLVAEDNAEAMNITAIDFPPGVNELEEAGLTTAPSTRVKPPRIAESPVAMECQLEQIVKIGDETGIVLGRIVAMHIHDEMVLNAQKHYIDTAKLKLIGRMGGSDGYARTSDLFKMPRIPLDKWKKN